MTIISLPFVAIWYGCEWLYKHFLRKKKPVEVPTEAKPHVTPVPNYGRFLFKENRIVKIPIDKIAYVETVPDETIHKLLEENKERIRYWEEWYGIKIIHVDYESIKQAMVYPQDFPFFKHGFIWQTEWSP